MMDAEEEPRTILCPNCGKEVPNTTFCISCGVKFDKNMLKITTKGESTQGTKLCPLCRKEIPDSHNFCHYCGGWSAHGLPSDCLVPSRDDEMVVTPLIEPIIAG